MKNFLTFFLFLISFCTCAYKFPEKLPAPFDIDTYTFNKVKFGQTSVNEFAYIAPNYDKPTVEGVYTIYKETNLNNTYKSLRAGFKNNFLDWIELEFAVPQSWNKFKQTYGKPAYVNENYSNKFNYQDYNFFNVVTDKNNSVVFGITLYGESDFNQSIANVVKKLPDYKSFNLVNEFVPGKMMENDFSTLYPNFKPNNKADDDTKVFSVPKKYLKHNNYYAGADLIFKNGILSFINLTPKNLSIIDVKQIYGEAKENSSGKKDLYYREYQNFIVTYNKATNKVIKIGIIGSD